MPQSQPNNPLHGYTLEVIVSSLADYYGWDELGEMIPIRCFTHDPSVKSSLKFLRKTPWARKKVEDLFVYTLETYGESDEGAPEA
ncbi:VF530 family protein [Coraliomargarita parva]|uniref:VF530 family protein n=1 Tax=Coraliomargarita parva TaxID=3014050 RepID=UPI0022B3C6D6|nr:VF530 family protein [Coraliomargarita parva]